MMQLPVIRHVRWVFRRTLCGLLWQLDALNGVDAMTIGHMRESDLLMLRQVWRGDI